MSIRRVDNILLSDKNRLDRIVCHGDTVKISEGAMWEIIELSSEDMQRLKANTGLEKDNKFLMDLEMRMGFGGRR